MTADLSKLAIDAEADRLCGVYLRVRTLAQAQRIDFIEAGRQAVAKGLVTEADWAMVHLAVGGV